MKSLVVKRHRSASGQGPLAIGALVVLLAGCGGSDRPQTVPTSGVVKLNGGDWPQAGTVMFLPIEPAAGCPRRPGKAEFDRSGAFVAGAFEANDGLVPGTYRVTVSCWETPPSMDGPPPVSYVPPKFQDASTSDLEVVIAPNDRRRRLEFDVR